MKSTLFISIEKVIRIKKINQKIAKNYLIWIKAYILFHDKRHPFELDARDMATFINHLRTNPKTPKNSAKQATNALLFMYHEVLQYSYEHLELSSQNAWPFLADFQPALQSGDSGGDVD